MNPTNRTLIFVAAAFVSAVIAYTSNQFTKPVELAGYGEFGQDFYRDFTDPTKATSIRVVSFDESLATSKKFIVVNDNGWRIPSHNDYPADGKDQLTKAATSIIGLKRGTLATRRKTEHERFGVIAPDDEESTATKGRGQRITLSQRDVVLADLIVGKKVEGDEEKRYIRRADEDKVYMVKAKFDISTKFSDWGLETDLLKLAGFDVLRLRASQPKYNENEELEGTEIVELTREKGGDPWKLDDLDATTEELKTDDINTMVTTLDDLRLVGVRPKPSFGGKPVLNADLKLSLPRELASDPQILNQVKMFLKSNLNEKGFKVGQDESGQTQIVSREGELTAGTKDGVVYRLTFGSVFSGTEEEIEIGDKDDKGDVKEGDKKKEDAPKKASKGKSEDLKKSRYLFVRAEFDEKLLGARPAEPEKPTPPPGVEPLAEDKPAGDTDKSDTDTKKKDAKAKESDKDASAEKPSESKQTDSKKSDEEPQEAKGNDQVVAFSDDKKKNDSETNSPPKKSDVKTDEPKPDSKDEKDKPAGDKPKPEAKKDEAKKDEAKKDEAKKDEAKKDEAKKDETKKDETKKDETKKDETKKDETKKDETKKDETKKTDPKAEYQEALKKYDVDKGRYNTDLKSFDSRIESGQAKVKELNDRFADWYYVISNESFDKLRLKRADLIKKKEPPAAKASDKPTSDQPASDKPAEDKSATEKPADGDAKPTKPAEKSADSEQPADVR